MIQWEPNLTETILRQVPAEVGSRKGEGHFLLKNGGLHTFSVKGQIVNMLGFVRLWVTSSQLCHCSSKATTSSMWTNEGGGVLKRTKQAVGQTWPTGRHYRSPGFEHRMCFQFWPCPLSAGVNFWGLWAIDRVSSCVALPSSSIFLQVKPGVNHLSCQVLRSPISESWEISKIIHMEPIAQRSPLRKCPLIVAVVLATFPNCILIQ